MRTMVIGLALAVALTGCQAKLPIGAGAQVPGVGQQGASPLRIGNLDFKPVSAETAAKLAQRNQSATRMAAPEAAPAPGAAGMAAADSAMVAPYYHGSYFGGPFGQMKLDSVTEAKAAGSQGSWKEIHSSIIAPVVAEWAPDARLVQTNGALGADGNLIEGKENYPGELAWRATYASAGRSEVLEFHVSTNETRVVKLRWTPVNLDVESLALDAPAALKALSAAIADPSVKSKEEVLGHDYFMGKDGMIGGVGIAVPAIAVDAPAPDAPVSSEPGIAPGEPYPRPLPQQDQPVYELSPGGRWHANLTAIGDHLVWELNYQPKPETMERPRSPGETFVDGYAYGMVDARTGDIIRMRRPMKITIPDYGQIEPRPLEPEPEPKPEPAELR